MRVIAVPPGTPRTKPRALNVGLALARGALITVYDAEDRPHPGQLRAAAAHYAGSPPRLGCLQGRLAITPDDRLLPRLFALEYAALFDLYNVGLARLRLPMPLGGTSNHFRGMGQQTPKVRSPLSSPLVSLQRPRLLLRVFQHQMRLSEHEEAVLEHEQDRSRHPMIHGARAYGGDNLCLSIDSSLCFTPPSIRGAT